MEHGHEVAIGAGQQPRRHLDDGDFAAERGVDAAELEPDVAAADDEQRLGNVGQLESGRRIEHSRAVERQRRDARGMRTGGENAVLELQIGRRRSAPAIRHRSGTGQRAPAPAELHLAQRPTCPTPPVSLSTTPCLNDRSLAMSTSGSGNVTPQALACRGLVDDFRDVQQRLRRNAAAIEADAAGVLLLVDERDLHAEIGGVECRGIAARPGAEDRNLRRFAPSG